MVERIEKLTPEQESMIPGWVEKWVKIGLCTDEADWELSEKSINECYVHAGLTPPKKYIRVQSPIVLEIAAPLALYFIKNLPKDSKSMAVGDAVRSAMHDAGDAVGSAVRSAVHSTVYDAVRSAVRDAVRSTVYDAVGDAVRSAMHDAVGDAVYDAVRSAVRSAVHDAGYDAVGKFITNNRHNYLGGQFWVSWQAYESFLHDVYGIKLKYNLSNMAISFRNAQSSSCWWYPATDFVMVCNRPKHIDMENGRLHSGTRLAIQWRDGWGLAFWKGVKIPNGWIETKPTAKEVLGHENVEVRRSGCELIGWDKVLDELGAKMVDSHPNPEIGDLYEVDLPDSPKECFLKVLCGTGRTFALPVDPSCKTALEANLWTYSLPNDASLVPEVRT
jgi:hypothetical protein